MIATLPGMRLIGYCEACNHRHPIEFNPNLNDMQLADWYAKHLGHTRTDGTPAVGFAYAQRPSVTTRLISTLKQFWGFRLAGKRIVGHRRGNLIDELGLPPDYQYPLQLAAMLANADVKIAYAASAAVTITLASLAASSTLLAGREGTAVDNGASNKYLDELLAGFYKTASSNLQAGTIQTAVVGNIDDTPTWPDVFDGTDSTETVTVQAMYDQVCRIISSIATDATQRTWPWGPCGIAGFFNGMLPDQYVVFVSHSAQTSTNAWSATEGDHAVKRTPVYATVV